LMRSILDVLMICPKCGHFATVGDCEPDVDGDGSLGCPAVRDRDFRGEPLAFCHAIMQDVDQWRAVETRKSVD
jgi:hypothetical protein